jgi:hypothetical protein
LFAAGKPFSSSSSSSSSSSFFFVPAPPKKEAAEGWMDFFAGDALVVSCESRGDPESGNLAFANTHTPEYPFFAVDTANLIVGYSGRSLVLRL